MPSARTLITDSLKTIGALAAGEAPTAAELNDAYRRLTDLLEAWRTQRLTIYEARRTTHTLVADQQEYSLGEGGDLDQVRPLSIDALGIIDSNDDESPLALLTEAEWIGMGLKDGISSTLPTSAYIEWSFPLANVILWPIPTEALTLAIYHPHALEAFADYDTDYDLPPGYARALRYNLAVELAPEFGRPLDPLVAGLAAESLATIKRANHRTVIVGVDEAVLVQVGGFDIGMGV